MFDLKAHLKTMVETHAPSGYEEPIRNVLRQEWAGLVDSMETDKLGSLIGIKRATQPLDPPRKIMLAAHMDELGMMVRDVVDGFIYVHRVSGVDNRIMLSQPVMVHGKREIPGIVASVPPHLLNADQRQKYPTFDELIIDVGLPAAEVEDLVHIGDLITPDAPMIDLNGTRIAGKAMDDRACVAAMTVCLNELKSLQHQWDVYAVATVQEETGLYGAATSAYKIQPDIAIALDVTFASQPGVDSDTGHDIGGGPVISMGPNFHTRMVEQIK
ncbi:MAG: M42 family peptidase, partial [Chloroflexota bacterium]